MNNLSLYCWLVDAKMRASDKDLSAPEVPTPLQGPKRRIATPMFKVNINLFIPVSVIGLLTWRPFHATFKERKNNNLTNASAFCVNMCLDYINAKCIPILVR